MKLDCWLEGFFKNESVASDRLARQCSSALLFKTKSDIVEGTKMCLRTKFTKPASLAIRAPVELIPTTKNRSSLNHLHLVSSELALWKHGKKIILNK